MTSHVVIGAGELAIYHAAALLHPDVVGVRLITTLGRAPPGVTRHLSLFFVYSSFLLLSRLDLQ